MATRKNGYTATEPDVFWSAVKGKVDLDPSSPPPLTSARVEEETIVPEETSTFGDVPLAPLEEVLVGSGCVKTEPIEGDPWGPVASPDQWDPLLLPGLDVKLEVKWDQAEHLPVGAINTKGVGGQWRLQSDPCKAEVPTSEGPLLLLGHQEGGSGNFTWWPLSEGPLLLPGHQEYPLLLSGHQEDGSGNFTWWPLSEGPLLLSGNQEDPLLLPGHQEDPLLLSGHQEDPLLLSGHQEDPLLLSGHQEDPLLLSGHQEDPLLLSGHQEDPLLLSGHQEDGSGRVTPNRAKVKVEEESSISVPSADEISVEVFEDFPSPSRPPGSVYDGYTFTSLTSVDAFRCSPPAVAEPDPCGDAKRRRRTYWGDETYVCDRQSCGRRFKFEGGFARHRLAHARVDGDGGPPAAPRHETPPLPETPPPRGGRTRLRIEALFQRAPPALGSTAAAHACSSCGGRLDADGRRHGTHYKCRLCSDDWPHWCDVCGGCFDTERSFTRHRCATGASPAGRRTLESRADDGAGAHGDGKRFACGMPSCGQRFGHELQLAHHSLAHLSI